VWDRLVEGQSGVAPITLFDASSFPSPIAAEVKDWEPSDADGLIAQPEGQTRQTLFAIQAADEAFRHAGLCQSKIEPSRLGAYLGCGEVYPDFTEFAQILGDSLGDDGLASDEFLRSLQDHADSLHMSSLEPDAPLGFITGRFEAHGPSQNYTTACVSSSVAIGEALELIRANHADVMFAGGAHSMIHPFGISGFHRLSTLTTRNGDAERAYRPFDRDRDGFVVGEGGVVLILEELEHARRRGAKIWAELTGYGSTHDAFRITDTRGDGSIAAKSMKLALQDASLSPEDVSYINAHGSGTVLNDKAETAAIKIALGDHAYRLPISSTKSMTGHLTTACGAIELLVCVLVLDRNVTPPTINYETPDADCDLDYVPNEAREVDCQHVLNMNLGFGGHNVALVVSRFEG
jgi:3-oxoacyl-[acyl-carrier-protein] synthase II